MFGGYSSLNTGNKTCYFGGQLALVKIAQILMLAISRASNTSTDDSLASEYIYHSLQWTGTTVMRRSMLFSKLISVFNVMADLVYVLFLNEVRCNQNI